jgi:hypothetical protein
MFLSFYIFLPIIKIIIIYVICIFNLLQVTPDMLFSNFPYLKS